MATGGQKFCRRNYTIDMEERSTGEIDMKKILTICAMVAALGAASGSVQARPSAAADPAAAAIRLEFVPIPRCHRCLLDLNYSSIALSGADAASLASPHLESYQRRFGNP
jgi:hypothetical protein